MSTKIFDAWRTPQHRISELVSIGGEVQKICSDSLADEMTAAIQQWPWTKQNIVLLLHVEPRQKLIAITQSILNRLLEENQSSPTWIADSNMCSTIVERLKKQCEENSISLNEKEIKALKNLIVDFYEYLARNGNPALTFLEGDDESTYIKGFQLTDAAKAWLDKEFQRFEYTNQCEMNVLDFDADVQKAVSQAKTPKESYAIIAQAQEKRGTQWDVAFHGKSVWKQAGLSFDCANEFGIQGLSAIAKKAIEKLFALYGETT